MRDIKTDSAVVFILALVIASISVFYQARIGQEFLLSDKGNFWYGGWRTWLGEVPIRDFDGYDPAHYLWYALWFRALGDSGLVAFRLADSIFVFIGTTFGLLALRKVVEWRWMLLVAGSIFLWSYPLFRSIDHAVSLAAVYFDALLIEHPSIKRHFIAGVFVGVAAFIGRNHGVYCALAYFLLIAFNCDVATGFDKPSPPPCQMPSGRLSCLPPSIPYHPYSLARLFLLKRVTDHRRLLSLLRLAPAHPA